METEPRYRFSWGLLGDIGKGRPNLGPSIRVEPYRLMQFCLRDVMEQDLGGEETDRIFFNAGKLAGSHFYAHVIGEATGLDELVRKIQRIVLSSSGSSLTRPSRQTRLRH